MIRKKKRTRKLRGSRTYGFGTVGQHRNKGQQGGFGKTGLKKGKKIWRIKFAPEAIGKHGFKRPQSLIKNVSSMNVGELELTIERLVERGLAS
ncbi:MAG: 50S ribosomal protein L15, partial [Candidatus Ranarchaeia archaeon]